MYPEHFLPVGSVLPVYDPATGTHKTYVPAKDRFLRESPDPSSPHLPAFRHTSENRGAFSHLNVFLVALNAEIKFRRYLRKVRLDPPATPLPDVVLHHMYRTRDLIEAIYWKAQPTKGSRGEAMIAGLLEQRQRNRARAARGGAAKVVESSSEIKDVQTSGPRGTKNASWEPWPEGADLETRMAYGRALMGGYGL
jgi:hypothetical protein